MDAPLTQPVMPPRWTAQGDGEQHTDAPVGMELVELDALGLAQKAALRQRWSTLQHKGFQWLGSAGSDWARVHACGFTHILSASKAQQPCFMIALRLLGRRILVCSGIEDSLNLYTAVVCADAMSAGLVGSIVEQASELGFDGLHLGPLPAAFFQSLEEHDVCVDDTHASEGHAGEGIVTPLPVARRSSFELALPSGMSRAGTTYSLPTGSLPICAASRSHLPSRNARRSLRKSQKVLETVGELSTVWTGSGDAAFDSALAELLDWKRQWLERKAYWGGSLRSSRIHREIDALVSAGHEGMGIHSLYVGDRAVSHLLVLTGDNGQARQTTEDYGYATGLISASSPEHQSASPAKVHMSLLQSGWGPIAPPTHFDMLPQHEEYKLRLGAQPIPLFERSHATTRRTRWLFRGLKLRKMLRTKVRETLERLPLPVRRLIVISLGKLKELSGSR